MLLNEASQDKLKKIRDSGKFCCIKIFSDFNYVWDINLVPYEELKSRPDGTKEDLHEVKWRSGSYEDLNDAVNSLYSQIETLLK